jgi:hypothetical protein
MPIVDGVRLTFGRCWKCNVAYRWRGKPKLKNAVCLKCHSRLHTTVHYLRSAPWLDQKPEEVMET